MVEGSRLLILFGIVLVVAGVLLSVTGRGWRLPGDILIRRDGVTVYIPIVTSLALSVILTLVLSLLARRR
jgi:hypothetical protein